MWDDARKLQRLANALFGLSFALILLGAAHYMVHLPAFAVRSIHLSIEPQRADAGQIEAAARAAMHGNFFTADLDGVRQAIEQVPWVHTASVRRVFPWALEVTLDEQVALARWNDAELVNTDGEVFPGQTDLILPKFDGAPGSAAEIAQMYRALSEKLAPLDQVIAQISLSPRHAWQLRLDNGTVLELGREQTVERLERYVRVYPGSLAPVQARYVDLRYRNGFAVLLPGGHV